MSIDFKCPACKKPYRVKDQLAGKTAKCTCGRRIQIPALPPESLDLTDLLDEDAERPKTPAPVPPRPKPDYEENRWLITGPAFLPLHRLLKRARSPLVKLVIGGVAGALLGLGAILTDIGPAVILATSIAGVAAAGLLIVADSVGKRSNAGRWLMVVVLLALIVVAVVGSFAYQAYRADQQERAKQKAKHSGEYERMIKEGIESGSVKISRPPGS